jgi:hypothetical protein
VKTSTIKTAVSNAVNNVKTAVQATSKTVSAKIAKQAAKTPTTIKSKTAAKSLPTTRKSNLTKEQRSAIARLAAFKAHTHKSFQADRTPDVRKLQIKLYNEALKNTRTHEPKTDRKEAIRDLAA